jgi:hypothetical protein
MHPNLHLVQIYFARSSPERVWATEHMMKSIEEKARLYGRFQGQSIVRPVYEPTSRLDVRQVCHTQVIWRRSERAFIIR